MSVLPKIAHIRSCCLHPHFLRLEMFGDSGDPEKNASSRGHSPGGTMLRLSVWVSTCTKTVAGKEVHSATWPWFQVCVTDPTCPHDGPAADGT